MPAPPTPPPPPHTSPGVAPPARPAARPVNSAVWVAAAGAGIFLIGVIFFLVWSIQRGWLGPEMRLLLGLVAGVGLTALAGRLILGNGRQIGVAVLLAGLGTLQFSFRAGAFTYHFFDPALGLAGAALATVLAGALAARAKSGAALSVALVSGLVAPLVFSEGGHHEVALAVYLLVVMAAVLAVPYLSGEGASWNTARWIAVAGTWALLAGAAADVLQEDAATLLLLLLAHLALAGLWIWLPGRREVPGTPTLLWVLTSLTATSLGSVLWHRLGWTAELYSVPVVAFAALNLALVVPLRARLGSRRADFGLLALAVGHLACAVPIALDWRWVGPLWALLALGLAWASGRARESSHAEEAATLRTLAFGLAVIASVRWVVHGTDFWFAAEETPFFNVAFVEGALAAAAWFLLARRTGQVSGPDRGQGRGFAFVACELVGNLTLAFECAHLVRWLAGRCHHGAVPPRVGHHDHPRAGAVGCSPVARRCAQGNSGGTPRSTRGRVLLAGVRRREADRRRPRRRRHPAAGPGVPRRGGDLPRCRTTGASAPARARVMRGAHRITPLVPLLLLLAACDGEDRTGLRRWPVGPVAGSGWSRVELDGAALSAAGLWLGDAAGRAVPYLEEREGLWPPRDLETTGLLLGHDGGGRPSAEFGLRLPDGWQVREREQLRMDLELEGEAPWVAQVEIARAIGGAGGSGEFLTLDSTPARFVYDLGAGHRLAEVTVPWDGERYRIALSPGQGKVPSLRGVRVRANTWPEGLAVDDVLEAVVVREAGSADGWRLDLPRPDRLVALDVTVEAPCAPVAIRVEAMPLKSDSEDPGKGGEPRDVSAAGLVWNLPALNTRATRVVFGPVIARTLRLRTPDGVRLVSVRALVRRQSLLFPAEAGQRYFVHAGGEARKAPGDLDALPASRAVYGREPLRLGPPEPDPQGLPRLVPGGERARPWLPWAVGLVVAALGLAAWRLMRA